ncbi:hypothetical protein GCM10023074_35470 [Microbispora amethystogenes]|uniref:Uncharacterized protein n=1 Tax=Microbispora amethystogenes TaxID=1427754 RepID=A0ABQ4FAZ4_9ACTN|nr:hypothetical protein Mam01_21650 [Microbispora amethystogenes]
MARVALADEDVPPGIGHRRAEAEEILPRGLREPVEQRSGRPRSSLAPPRHVGTPKRSMTGRALHVTGSWRGPNAKTPLVTHYTHNVVTLIRHAM